MRTGLMSSRNSPTLTLDVRHRRAEPCAAGLVLVGVACAVPWLPDPTSWTTLLGGAACLAAMGFGLWRAGWIGSRHRITRLRWLADGRWVLADSRDQACHAELSTRTRLAGTTLWLCWRTSRGLRSMLLAPGDLPVNELRALCVRLRVEALERALPEAHGR